MKRKYSRLLVKTQDKTREQDAPRKVIGVMLTKHALQMQRIHVTPYERCHVNKNQDSSHRPAFTLRPESVTFIFRFVPISPLFLLLSLQITSLFKTLEFNLFLHHRVLYSYVNRFGLQGIRLKGRFSASYFQF